MAYRTIVQDGDEILRKECRPVTAFNERLAATLDDMQDTLIQADGLGLAAPQVGVLRRYFIVRVDLIEAAEAAEAEGCITESAAEPRFVEFINPEFLSLSEEKETDYEGCLSFPGHTGAVERSVRCTVRAQDRSGAWFEVEAEGLYARCIQHENDHLNGLTIMQQAKSFLEDEAAQEGKE